MRTATVTLAAAVALTGCSALSQLGNTTPTDDTAEVADVADVAGTTFTVDGGWWNIDVPDDTDLTDGEGDTVAAEANWGGDTGVLLLVETVTMSSGDIGLERLAQVRFGAAIDDVGFGAQEPPYEVDVLGADEAWRIDGYLDRGDAGTQHVAMVAARSGDRVVIVDGNWKDSTPDEHLGQLEAALASLIVEPSA